MVLGKVLESFSIIGKPSLNYNLSYPLPTDAYMLIEIGFPPVGAIHELPLQVETLSPKTIRA
jgi:hypothetical protein